MDKVRITNPVGTSENVYESPVAISVNGVPWGPLAASVNAPAPDKVGNVAPAPGSSASAPVIPQGASELGILNVIWSGKVDSASRLLGKNGEVITEPTPDDPWPASVDHDPMHDGVYALEQFQFDHNNRPDQIYIDGQPAGQKGIDPGVRYSSTKVPGKLTLEFSPPVSQKITLPPITATAADPQRVTVAPPAGHQMTLTLHGPTVVTLTDLQAPTVPGRMAFVRLTDKAGQQMPTGDVRVVDEYGTAYTAAANGFDCQIAVGKSVAGANVIVGEGRSLTVEALGLSSDVLMDYRSADWG